MTRLADLGDRICIFGPSNSGKSTLACSIGAARGLEVIHIDLLYHRPGTDWEARPGAEFLTAHDEMIAHEGWVMDGNYTRCMPQRLQRATGVILLDVSTTTSLMRYFRRSLFEGDRRAGALPGGRDSIKWDMIRHIAVTQRKNRMRYAAQVAALNLPKIALMSRRAIKDFYETEGLSRSTSRTSGIRGEGTSP